MHLSVRKRVATVLNGNVQHYSVTSEQKVVFRKILMEQHCKSIVIFFFYEGFVLKAKRFNALLMEVGPLSADLKSNSAAGSREMARVAAYCKSSSIFTCQRLKHCTVVQNFYILSRNKCVDFLGSSSSQP